MGAFTRNYNRVEAAFDRDTLARICEMHETEFASAFEMGTRYVEQSAPDNFYLFRDHGSSVLAVAHLDTVGLHADRVATFADTASGPVVYSRALDDRLGAYIILDLLPKLGVQFDILLTVGEESGMSTADFFEPSKDYDWIIEFDRGGTDVVMYQYDDESTRAAVRRCGARVGDGIFSDICYLEHLGVKAFNWGVGYRDYHGPRAHAYLEDTFEMVARFLKFESIHYGVEMPHEETRKYYYDISLTREVADQDLWDDDDLVAEGWAQADDSPWDENGVLITGAHDDSDPYWGWGAKSNPTQEEINYWDRVASDDSFDRGWIERVRAGG